LLTALGLLLPAAASRAANCAGTATGKVPLTDLGAGMYFGYPGGLYPGGVNTRPAAHEAAGVAIANALAPLDTFGVADASGSVVVISIGMSNATQEFSTFVPLATADPLKRANVRVIDCALGGQTAAAIRNPAAAYWDTVRTRLRGRGSSPAQVQVAWIKEANAGPTAGFPAAAQTLAADLAEVTRVLKDHFPNVRLAYLSSRIYAGYASTALNPEPYAYESGFSVRWVLETQIAGEDSLNYDPDAGPVEAPWLAWGPYLWADGLLPRGGDGLTWACSDFAADGTHPAPSGRTKVANLLLDFFRNDATAVPWYRDPVAEVDPHPDPLATGASLAIAPNPASDLVEVSFAVPAGVRWTLDVLDAAGRRVHALERGAGDGATRTLRWTPPPAMPAGVYWVRLIGGATSVTRRIALLGAR
jgi:hypothetical protein